MQLTDEFLKTQMEDWDWCYPPELRRRAEFMDQYEVISMADHIPNIRPRQCHMFSAHAWFSMSNILTFCTGYAFSTGKWFRHSWVLNEGEKQIADLTPVRWERYYGTKLNLREAYIFHKALEEGEKLEENWLARLFNKALQINNKPSMD